MLSRCNKRTASQSSNHDKNLRSSGRQLFAAGAFVVIVIVGIAVVIVVIVFVVVRVVEIYIVIAVVVFIIVVVIDVDVVVVVIIVEKLASWCSSRVVSSCRSQYLVCLRFRWKGLPLLVLTSTGTTKTRTSLAQNDQKMSKGCDDGDDDDDIYVVIIFFSS